MHRHDTVQERRHDPGFIWELSVDVRALEVGASQDAFGIARPERIAHGGNVARDRTIAERNDDFRASADLVNLFEMILVRNGAFDQHDIDVPWVFFDIHDRAEDHIHKL